eukprot:TRINITY_DN5355_c0_g1_i1.p1 TRINITY_DN5355_c0_g1~~TRINITY_DN5355_c0_g1_i1.p1  ORF type:complete len:1016 (+),score=342.51 TRINITY_DN5355_c0_g1_i1:37-3084(+)
MSQIQKLYSWSFLNHLQKSVNHPLQTAQLLLDELKRTQQLLFSEQLTQVHAKSTEEEAFTNRAIVHRLLYLVEKSLYHGLKDIAFFGFTEWFDYAENVVLNGAPQVLSRVRKATRSRLGRSRVLIRLLLKSGSLADYLNALVANRDLTTQYYEDWAILRREEQCSILIMLVESVNGLKFESILYEKGIDDVDYWITVPFSSNALLEREVADQRLIRPQEAVSTSLSTQTKGSTILPSSGSASNQSWGDAVLQSTSTTVFQWLGNILQEGPPPSHEPPPPPRKSSTFASPSSPDSKSSSIDQMIDFTPLPINTSPVIKDLLQFDDVSTQESTSTVQDVKKEEKTKDFVEELKKAEELLRKSEQENEKKTEDIREMLEQLKDRDMVADRLAQENLQLSTQLSKLQEVVSQQQFFDQENQQLRKDLNEAFVRLEEMGELIASSSRHSEEIKTSLQVEKDSNQERERENLGKISELTSEVELLRAQNQQLSTLLTQKENDHQQSQLHQQTQQDLTQQHLRDELDLVHQQNQQLQLQVSQQQQITEQKQEQEKEDEIKGSSDHEKTKNRIEEELQVQNQKLEQQLINQQQEHQQRLHEQQQQQQEQTRGLVQQQQELAQQQQQANTQLQQQLEELRLQNQQLLNEISQQNQQREVRQQQEQQNEKVVREEAEDTPSELQLLLTAREIELDEARTIIAQLTDRVNSLEEAAAQAQLHKTRPEKRSSEKRTLSRAQSSNLSPSSTPSQPHQEPVIVPPSLHTPQSSLSSINRTSTPNRVRRSQLNPSPMLQEKLAVFSSESPAPAPSANITLGRSSSSASVLLHRSAADKERDKELVVDLGQGVKRIGSLRFEMFDDFDDALRLLKHPSSFSGWLLLGYTNQNTLTLQKWCLDGSIYSAEHREGEPLFPDETQEVNLETMQKNVLSSLVQNLDNNQLQYSIIRLFVGDSGRKESTTHTTRDIFVTWVGPSLPTIELAKKKFHLGDIKKVVQFHRELNAFGKTHFDEATLKYLLVTPSESTIN